MVAHEKNEREREREREREKEREIEQEKKPTECYNTLFPPFLLFFFFFFFWNQLEIFLTCASFTDDFDSNFFCGVYDMIFVYLLFETLVYI